MHQTRRVPIVDLNDYLTCKLCKGYFIDATTIIECLHTFCRTCIVQYLDKNKYCPVCDVQVHKTKPLLNIRPDKTLQDIVYKLVPRLFQNEMCRRREFYQSHPEGRPSNLEQCGEASYQHILSPDETICLSLNYHGSGTPPRYLRCPTAVSIMHLQKLLRSKYDLSENHRVDILHNQDCLNSHLTLIDIAYIYLWRRNGPLELTYRIYENTIKKLNSNTQSETLDDPAKSENSEWKEVQLRISENGEMCFTGVDECVISKCDKKSNLEDEQEETPRENDEKPIANDTSKLVGKENTTSTTTTIQSTIAPIKAETEVVQNVKPPNCVNSGEERTVGGKFKHADACEGEPVTKQPKQTILNHTLGIHNLSNNHPLKRHSQIRKSVESATPNDLKITTTSTTTIATTTTSSIYSKQNSSPKPVYGPGRLQTNLPCYAPKTNYNPVINVPKVQASTSMSRIEQKVPTPSSAQPQTILNNKTGKNKTGHPIGYKTLRDPPKTWNPQISRASLLKSPDPKYTDLKNVRPAKFFKMRNNMPRYLGNPASGVKPLYQVHNSPEKDKNSESKTEIKKHSIVKVDPKTLKPISEKAPEISNLTNQIDLKINTSSVPIFNPLKLQSSPKSERKSPKSPHSPKPKSTSPSNKRDKLNLSYTPPNPFIPNLASPTLSPNQFLYPPGPPGFPAYDPRIMAAYHNLLYGQRAPYPASPLPPTLNLDMNRKSFELPAPGSASNQPKSPNDSPKANNVKPKRTKDSVKNEKSLENTVEKLTQNRVKEMTTKTDELAKSENGRKTPIDVAEKSKSDVEHSSDKNEVPVTNNDSKINADLGDNKSVSSNNNNSSDSVSLKVGDEKK
ncbi:hypothetical protein FQR65_LT06938 [Abscondita terminalis]|nr:hypothetical protein FQR65_LT06938 [Abscondita terminalis]